MSPTAFAKLAQLGEQLEQTRLRRELAALLAGFLTGLEADEIPPAVRLTIGQVFPEWDERSLNVSWKALMAVVDDLVDATPEARQQIWSEAVDGGEGIRSLLEKSRHQPPLPPSLTILDVYRTLEAIAGTTGRGSRARKAELLKGLLDRATAVEAKYVAKVIYQEMRHGVSEGIMLDGIAQAAGIKTRPVRRANQFWGDLGEVAFVALTDGESGLSKASVRLFRPIKPMLAQTAEGLDEAFERFGGTLALEYKLDGARVQIHCKGQEVRIYSRNLADVTASLPEVAAAVSAGLEADEAILEGEVVAVDAHDRPLPFQHVMRRFRRKHDVAAMVEEIPVRLYLFDLLYVNGYSLVDAPNRQRWTALKDAAGRLGLVPRRMPENVQEAEGFARTAHTEGHEGVMAKDLASSYTPGVRGKTWLKLKHIMSLDLVIVAADWGYGRRHGWLSNYHLAARDSQSGEFLVVGKTYKGLTDVEFQAMTERLLDLERSRKGSTVQVAPQVVVEVLFNEIQESSQYHSGLALRFARITALREDKAADEADTLQTLRRLFEQQFRYKGRPR